MIESVYYNYHMSTSRITRRGQVVLYQGEVSPYIFAIKSGVVRAYTIVDGGNEVIIAMFGPGDHFPEQTNLDELPAAMFYYDMMSDGELTLLTQREYSQQQAKSSTEHVRSQQRYLGALLHINALAQPTARGRIVHVIRYLALRFGVPASGKSFTRINLKLTQQDLAQICNLSRETVNHEIKYLKDRTILTVRQKNYTVNIRALMKLIDDDIDISLSAD